MSVRQVQNWTSEPRLTYLSRAQERRVKIRELRATGMSMRAVAAEIGCSVGTVHNALKDTDQPPPSEQSGHVQERVHGRPRTCP
ncbi:helix-turn-helix domain-containing protein [Tomitella cavernea]|uniref:Transposase IS30-like HTH domain-containing protein n=1 Tax=Tomitella cavernea TaxID=1387982 RepID=A0ABP9D8W7_9ACTN